MTVREFFLMNTVYDKFPANYSELKGAEFLTQGILFNCSARIEYVEEDGKKKLETKGNVTEQGLIKFLMEMKVDAQHILRTKEDNILEIIPFNSGRKRATTAVRLPDD